MTYHKDTPVSSPPQNRNCGGFLGLLLLFSMMSKDPDVDSMLDVFLKWLTQVHSSIILRLFFFNLIKTCSAECGLNFMKIQSQVMRGAVNGNHFYVFCLLKGLSQD